MGSPCSNDETARAAKKKDTKGRTGHSERSSSSAVGAADPPIKPPTLLAVPDCRSRRPHHHQALSFALTGAFLPRVFNTRRVLYARCQASVPNLWRSSALAIASPILRSRCRTVRAEVHEPLDARHAQKGPAPDTLRNRSGNTLGEPALGPDIVQTSPPKQQKTVLLAA